MLFKIKKRSKEKCSIEFSLKASIDENAFLKDI